ncbi:MAG: carbon storage regulator [Nitrospirae bacterium]|nr:MAG: carbon storage regulator [Nitrospirota bacterium]
MLILTRKINEAIRLGDDIRIVLVQVKGGQVRIGIECPPHIRVLREELYEAVKKENLRALSPDVEHLRTLASRRMRPPHDNRSIDSSSSSEPSS